MNEKELFEKVMTVLNKGCNVEIRKKPDGSIQVLKVNKTIVR